MIRLTQKFLALSALAVALTSATSAKAGVIVQFAGRTGDTFNYTVSASPEGVVDLVFNAGDTITIAGVSSAAVASVVVPTFPGVTPFFTTSYTSSPDALVFTAVANSFETSGGEVIGTFSIVAVSGATNGSGSWITVYHTETGPIGRNTGNDLTIPIAPIVPTNGVPEPSTVALAAVGLVGAAFARRKRKA